VFPDQFLPNAAICAAGLATAIFWLRTGMVQRGFALLAALAIATDVALVGRFVYADRGAWFFAALWLLQSAAALATACLLVALARRRWSADARRRDELFAAGFQHYLRDELSPARDLFARILRTNPWDVAATVAMANVCWRQGRRARAMRLMQRARRLDRGSGYTDFIGEQSRRIGQGPVRRGLAPPN